MQRNDKVTVVANGRIIEVPQSYVDRFPEQYKPVELTKSGELRAKDQKLEDARGKALPPFASKPSDLPVTGSTAASTDVVDTTSGASGAGDTDGGATA